ncbi:hypothetical protein SAMN04515648_2953 [Phyllobacterium sp. CL33Tsu]|uniref:hypothetical protein n=1 Tax=Phyllobacterium sp. CL33Tsu TaxID=1798191 RepID=UPI0008F2F681|nr:hypothetical protein [Phyllobacterium sp. CL33Tsu]SFJ16415.1 hypothetical protein SAMN04515648_2953 [Phyllobacterium sp. CL33Tsu]
MPKLPDLHQLPNNPWDGPVDRPDPKVIEERRQAMTDIIDALPAGSLSSGVVAYDPSDPSTMWASDDPKMRQFPVMAPTGSR